MPTSLLKILTYLFFNRSNFGCPKVSILTCLSFNLGIFSKSFFPQRINELMRLKKNLEYNTFVPKSSANYTGPSSSITIT